MMAVASSESIDRAEMVARAKARRSVTEDRVFYWMTLLSAVFVVVMLVGVMVSLVVGAWPALAKFGPAFV